jgi:hypothetical protein
MLVFVSTSYTIDRPRGIDSYSKVEKFKKVHSNTSVKRTNRILLSLKHKHTPSWITRFLPTRQALKKHLVFIFPQPVSAEKTTQ